jgi:hypothetical protein
MAPAGGWGSERGQSAVVGIVLLVGIVAISSTGILLLSTEAQQANQERVSQEQAERAFVLLDKRVSTVARSESGSRSVSLGIDADNGAIRKENTGRIVVRSTDRNTELLNTSIGAVVYETAGTTYAYQAGGVWRGSGANTQMISAPEVNYREASLSLTMTVLSGEEQLDADPISISKNKTPKFKRFDMIEGEVLVMEIHSEYYAGWATYFRERVDNAAVTVDAPNETVVVELGRIDPDANFQDGVTASGDINFGGGSTVVSGNVSASGSVNDPSRVTGDVETGAEYDMAPIDRVIYRKIEDAKTNTTYVDLDEDLDGLSDTDGDSIPELQGGTTYFAPDGIDLDGSVHADLSTGNVTLIVDGDIVVDDGAITVTDHGGERALRTYTNGSIALDNQDWDVAGGSQDAEHNQIYGVSTTQFALDNAGHFEGTLYAPREEEVQGDNEAWSEISGNNKCDRTATDDYDVCISTGSATVDGSIIAGSMFMAQSADLNYDSELRTLEPVLHNEGTALPPPLTRVTITVYEVDVSDGNDD